MNEQLTKLFRSAAVYGFGRILGKVISFLLIPFYTHYFSAAEYGVIEVLNLTTMIAAVLLAPGLATAVMRFYYETDDPKEQNVNIATGVIFTLVLGGLVSLLAILFPGRLADMLLGSERYRTLVQLAACGMFFTFSSDISWVYLRSKQRSWLYTVMTQGFFLGSIGLNVYFVAVRRMGVAGSFWANIVVSAVVWVALLWLTVRDVGLHLNMARAGRLLRFGAPLFTVWVAAFVLNFSDRFFLQRFYGIDAVGVYAVGYKFAYIMSLLVVQPFHLMWEPQSYEISKRDDARELFSRIFVLYSATLIAAAAVLSLVIPEVFEVMVDSKFQVACSFVPLIAFAYAIQGMGLYFEAGLLIRKKNLTLSMIGTASTAVCLALNFFLIRAWAAWGAVWATVLSFMFLSVLSYWFSTRVYAFDAGWGKILKVLIAGGALLGPGYLLHLQSLALRIAGKSTLLAVFLFTLSRIGVLPSGLMAATYRGAIDSMRERLALTAQWIAGRSRAKTSSRVPRPAGAGARVEGEN